MGIKGHPSDSKYKKPFYGEALVTEKTRCILSLFSARRLSLSESDESAVKHFVIPFETAFFADTVLGSGR
jgi:hypothetical protein